MPELSEILDEVHGYVRIDIAAGFDPPAAIIDSVVDVMSDEYDAVILRRLVEQVVAEQLAAHLAEQAAWPTTTDCDRLDAAFAALEAHGIVCRQHFSCCGSCGAAEIWDVIAEERAGGRAVCGYAFYHWQDTEAAIDGYGLHLNYGAVAQTESAALDVARAIVAALDAHGLATEWSGVWSERIYVALEWKRRRLS
jgi:hypothetical protein